MSHHHAEAVRLWYGSRTNTDLRNTLIERARFSKIDKNRQGGNAFGNANWPTLATLNTRLCKHDNKSNKKKFGKVVVKFGSVENKP